MNRFCHACGHKLEANQDFCAECGTPQQINKAENNSTPQQAVSRKPMSFKKKLSFMLVAILAVGLLAGHQIIKANTSPQEQVDAFLAALEAGDTETVISEISIPANVQKDDQAFIDFLQSQDLDDFQIRMYEAASGVINDGIRRIVSHDNGTELFRLKEEKFIGLYPVIQIESIPVEVQVTTDFEAGQFELGDKIADLGNGETDLGSYLPGLYQSKFSMKNGEVEKSVEFEQEIWGAEDAAIELFSDWIAVEIWSNASDATVYVNGESTGKTVEDLNIIGPIKEDETISLYVERENAQGELETSEEITATAGDFVELPLFTSIALSEKAEDSSVQSEEEKEVSGPFSEESLKIFVTDFRSAYEASLNEKNFSLIDEFLLESSIAREELVDFIGDIGDDYYLYEFIEDNVIEYEIQEEKAFVTTFEEFDFTNHLDDITNYKRNKRYEVVLNDGGQYRIATIDILDTVREN